MLSIMPAVHANARQFSSTPSRSPSSRPVQLSTQQHLDRLSEQVQVMTTNNTLLLSAIDVPSSPSPSPSRSHSPSPPVSLTGLSSLASFLSTSTPLLEDPDRSSRGRGARDFVSLLSSPQIKALLAACHARLDDDSAAPSSPPPPPSSSSSSLSPPAAKKKNNSVVPPASLSPPPQPSSRAGSVPSSAELSSILSAYGNPAGAVAAAAFRPSRPSPVSSAAAAAVSSVSVSCLSSFSPMVPPSVSSRYSSSVLLSSVLRFLGPEVFLSALLKAHEYNEDGLFRVLLNGAGVTSDDTDDTFWDEIVGRRDGDDEEGEDYYDDDDESKEDEDEEEEEEEEEEKEDQNEDPVVVVVAAVVAKKSGWLKRKSSRMFPTPPGLELHSRLYFSLLVGSSTVGPRLACYKSDRTTNVEIGSLTLRGCTIVDTTPDEDPVLGLKGVFSFSIRYYTNGNKTTSASKDFCAPDKKSHDLWIAALRREIRDDCDAAKKEESDDIADGATSFALLLLHDGHEHERRGQVVTAAAASNPAPERQSSEQTPPPPPPPPRSPPSAVPSSPPTTSQSTSAAAFPVSSIPPRAPAVAQSPASSSKTFSSANVVSVQPPPPPSSAKGFRRSASDAPAPSPTKNGFDAAQLPDSYWEADNLFDPSELPSSFWAPGNLFELFDQNGDNLIDFGELVIGLTIALNRKVSLEETQQYMKLYDRDSNGGLDREEFVQLIVDVKGGGNFPSSSSSFGFTSFLKRRKKPTDKENKEAVKDARAIVLQAAAAAAAKAVLSS